MYRWYLNEFMYDEWICSIQCLIDRLSMLRFRPIIYQQLVSSCSLVFSGDMEQIKSKDNMKGGMEEGKGELKKRLIYMHIWRRWK